MRSFLSDIADRYAPLGRGLSDYVFVLPSKRAGWALGEQLLGRVNTPLLAPEIWSIEPFVAELAQKHHPGNTVLLLELYEAYRSLLLENQDSFQVFLGWGPTLLGDFEEIDRYLIPAKTLMSDLNYLQELNHWSQEEHTTPMVGNYMAFWQILYPLYQAFEERISAKGWAHQGLLYRRASEKIDEYLKDHSDKKWVFIGFNALNKAEEVIFQKMLESSRASAYWDIDLHYLNDPVHDAGHFMRQYKQWPYYQNHPFLGPESYGQTSQKIQLIGIPKTVAQMQYCGQLLRALSEDERNKTAVILGDETALNPLIHALPEEATANITMGFPVPSSLMASLWRLVWTLGSRGDDTPIHKPDLVALVTHPLLTPFWEAQLPGFLALFRERIIHQTKTYWTLDALIRAIPEASSLWQKYFEGWSQAPLEFIARQQRFTERLMEHDSLADDPTAGSVLWHVHEVWQELSHIAGQYSFVDQPKSLQYLFDQLLAQRQLNFQGDALVGLQVMGMLESRNLDFEQVVITHVNEGLLPAGRTTNSHLPYALKKAFGLPTFKEKDAVYTYHFYRLLQRAKKVYLTYNTAPDVLAGGEKSRWIHQLLADELTRKKCVELPVSPNSDFHPNNLLTVQKNPEVISVIKEHLSAKISASALMAYLRNPLDFYRKYVLKIEEPNPFDGQISHRVFGNIVHDSLYELYTPLVGKFCSPEALTEVKQKIAPVVRAQFKEKQEDPEKTTGRNALALSVLIKSVENLVDYDLELAQQGSLEIVSLEETYTQSLSLPGIDFPLALYGKIDRIDRLNGVLRIIDYKTGRVIPSEVTLNSWDQLLSGSGKEKAFQLLFYGLLTQNHPSLQGPITGGIFSFKNCKDGVMGFVDKSQKPPQTLLDDPLLDAFKKQLSSLVLELLDPELPFVQKEIEEQ